jgi:hypothetical protein
MFDRLGKLFEMRSKDIPIVAVSLKGFFNRGAAFVNGKLNISQFLFLGKVRIRFDRQ